MNILFYIILFLIGASCGCFYKVAVYKIPKNMDLLKKHTYYENSNARSDFLKKVSILIYMLLGGFSFVVIAKNLQFNINSINFSSIIIYIFTMLYISSIIVMTGIDREYIKIEKKVLAFGIIVSIFYMIYLCAINQAVVYRYVAYLAIYIILLTIDTLLLRRYAKDSYTIDMLMLLNIMLIFSEVEMLFYTVLMAIAAIFIYILLLKIRQKKTGNKKIKLSEVPVGFFIGASNIAVLYMITFITNFCNMH